MATISTEVYWTREVMPGSIRTLSEQLQQVYGVGWESIGSKGDTNHTYGYHRSREWILNSAWSQYGAGDYSVQNGQDRGGLDTWLCAMDINPGNVDELIVMCQRLDAAVRRGEVPQLREWYGNVDGDQVVDGWDLLAGRAASSDSSHLWHLHLSFLRGLAGDDHGNLFRILTGGDDMSGRSDEILAAIAGGVPSLGDGTVVAPVVWRQRDELWQAEVFARLAAAQAREESLMEVVKGLVKALEAAGGSVDAAPIITAVTAVGTRMEAQLEKFRAQVAAGERAQAAALKS